MTENAEVNDTRPENCMFRLKDEGKPFPKSSCEGCGLNIGTGLGKYCAEGEALGDVASDEDKSYLEFVPTAPTNSRFEGQPPAIQNVQLRWLVKGDGKLEQRTLQYRKLQRLIPYHASDSRGRYRWTEWVSVPMVWGEDHE